MITKICTRCGVEKDLEDFRPYVGRSRDGRRPLCRLCHRAYEKRWRDSTPEKQKARRLQRRDLARQYGLTRRHNARAKYLVTACRARCVKKNIPFDLHEHIPEIQTRLDKGFCEVTGFPFDLRPREMEETGRRPATPSLDRKNPKGGYLLSNIRVVCFAVNAAMGDWGEKETLPIMEAWLRNRT